MNCTCLETVRKKLSAHHGAEVDLDLKTVIDAKTMELSEALPPLYYSYQSGKKRKKAFVTFNFCPFCGKK